MPVSLAIVGREHPWFDDQLIAEELRSRSVDVHLVDWRSPAFEPEQYDAIYVSSTWNLRQDPDGFLKWLARCEADGKQRLINDAGVLREGVIKSMYLTAMAEHFGEEDKPEGSITPSRFFALTPNADRCTRSTNGQSFSILVQALEREAPVWEQDLVIKPIVSADGHDTFTVMRSGSQARVKKEHALTMDQAEAAFEKVLHTSGGYGAILQSFQSGIDAGEVSLIYLGGVFSHAIRKPPGFRSSDTSQRKALAPEDLSPQMRDFADAITRWADQRYGTGSVTRARIDLIDGEHGPVLCEFECVEPNTNLRSFDEKARASLVRGYADALQARISVLAGGA